MKGCDKTEKGRRRKGQEGGERKWRGGKERVRGRKREEEKEKV